MSPYKFFKKSLRKMLPLSLFAEVQYLRHKIKRFLRWNYWRIIHPGKERSCPYCKKSFGRFIPYVNPYKVSQDLDIVSGQNIEEFNCPYCHSSDRERGLYFYFQENKNLFLNKKILHFAPEQNFYLFIKQFQYEQYVCADLSPKNYCHFLKHVEQIDICHINYPDEYFDMVICNHVLEHIPDDKTAMKEIFRVLKKEGRALLLVPIGAKLKETFEDPIKVTEEERSETFGQYDHIRVYAESDYINRLKSVGFEIEIINTPSTPDTEKCGINKREKFYMAHKH